MQAITAILRSVRVSAALGVLLVSESHAAPAELPPRGYASSQYVDSAGCVFLRVEIDGAPLWAERVDAAGAPLCGHAPSLGSAEIKAVTGTARNPVFPESGIYVQVGAFAQADNAARTALQIAARGYPVARLDLGPRSRLRSVVYAGPFPDADAANAGRRGVVDLGFADAFLRFAE